MICTDTRFRWRYILFMLLFLGTTSAALAAPGFALKDMDGKTHTLQDYKGRWVLVNFWATWCPPCLEEIPDLIALSDKRKDIAVIGVAVEYESAKEVRKFVDDNLMNYPVVLGDERTIRAFGSADVLPTSYLYNPQGQLVRTHRGLITRQQIERVVSGK